ncbi:hypothetical protein SLEP1_g41617 [Rubroshorea leprosula]|uniref:Uncharacterized protein n=1 Tax=Rubroshorea leprosula TaxID=152421 RepID=A0AAV5L732_9ROSI|nr:hypothetical protein SLEP1_g41617 [Rubroshorea leprosula]
MTLVELAITFIRSAFSSDDKHLMRMSFLTAAQGSFISLILRSGIFSNWLNNKEAVDLLNRLRSGYQMDKFYYADLCEEIDSYCRKCSRQWRVSFIDNYLTKPWAIVSVIFTAIVLVFTIMQVFYK